jgi:hypothetical protein
MARQYFNSQLADSAIVSSSITPSTTKTFLFTQAKANQSFPLPAGLGVSAPFAGQIFRFAMGGLITTPATGTLVIEATHGPGSSSTAGGTGMGPSAAQTVTASLSGVPWRIEGELIYRTIASSALGSTAWLTGVFMSQGTLADAGGGFVIPFGSTAAVSVDTSGLSSADLFGALNLYVTFSVTGATISVQWTSMQSLN